MPTQEIIVAGFHRSGTSLLTQLLHAAGLFVGDDLIGAMPSNPFGHFEDRRIVQLHNAILRDNGLDWQVHDPFVPVITSSRWDEMKALVADRRAAHRVWGFKDPRVCLFLPHWVHLMPEAKVVAVYRHPRDSILSLERRHVADLLADSGPAHIHRRFFEIPDLGLRMWLLSNTLLAHFVEQQPRSSLLLSFDSLSRGAPVLQRMRSQWGTGLEEIDTLTVFDPSVTSAGVRRRDVFDPDLLDRCLDLWDRLTSLSDATLAGMARAS